MVDRDNRTETRRQERFYLLVAAMGLGLLLVSGILRRPTLSFAAVLVHVAGAVVIVVWAASGIAAARRQAREERAALERAEQAREAREARQRAAAQVRAKRTVSHGGMTINVRRKAAGRDASDAGSSRERG